MEGGKTAQPTRVWIIIYTKDIFKSSSVLFLQVYRGVYFVPISPLSASKMGRGNPLPRHDNIYSSRAPFTLISHPYKCYSFGVFFVFLLSFLFPYRWHLPHLLKFLFLRFYPVGHHVRSPLGGGGGGLSENVRVRYIAAWLRYEFLKKSRQQYYLI